MSSGTAAPERSTPPRSTIRMPAEWEPHEATWLAWPHNHADWPGKFEPIPWVYVDIIRHLQRVEHVRILVNTREAATQAGAMLEKAGVGAERITFYVIPTDRVWTRDFGPIFVKDDQGEVAPTKWRFNAWAKYENWQLDDAAGLTIVEALARERLDHGKPAFGNIYQPLWKGNRVVLEGGSIDVNGCGTMLTTEECLLSDVQSRNPGMSRRDLEQVFARILGVRIVLWLKRGIVGDDTHGHVDDLARFVNPTTVVAVTEDDQGDPNHEPLRENLELLRSMTDQNGQPLRIVPLPMPSPLYFDGQRLPASYANFYIANGIVLVPTFNDARDRIALNTLAELFPNRHVIGIHCGDLVWGFGTLHCMTQQQPR